MPSREPFVQFEQNYYRDGGYPAQGNGECKLLRRFLWRVCLALKRRERWWFCWGCYRCCPPQRRVLFLLFPRQESTEGKTDQEYGTENLRHGRLDGVLVGVRHRPFFKALLSFLLWGNLHLNLKHNRRNERATMGVVLESDSEDEEKVLPQKKEESSDSEVCMFISSRSCSSSSRCCCRCRCCVIKSASLGDDDFWIQFVSLALSFYALRRV